MARSCTLGVVSSLPTSRCWDSASTCHASGYVSGLCVARVSFGKRSLEAVASPAPCCVAKSSLHAIPPAPKSSGFIASCGLSARHFASVSCSARQRRRMDSCLCAISIARLDQQEQRRDLLQIQNASPSRAPSPAFLCHSGFCACIIGLPAATAHEARCIRHAMVNGTEQIEIFVHTIETHVVGIIKHSNERLNTIEF